MNNSDTNQAKQLNETAVMRGFQIGNIVSRGFMNPTPTGLKKEYEPCEIKSLGIEKIIVNSKINSNELIKMSYENIKPVEISEYFLSKFGFGKSDEHELGNNLNDNFGFYYDYHFKKFRLETFDNDGLNCADIFLNIKYIHELQNLYFSLTGCFLNLV